MELEHLSIQTGKLVINKSLWKRDGFLQLEEDDQGCVCIDEDEMGSSHSLHRCSPRVSPVCCVLD